MPLLEAKMDDCRVTFIELVVADDPQPEPATQLFWVRDRIFLRVPHHLHPDLVAAIVDAIAQC